MSTVKKKYNSTKIKFKKITIDNKNNRNTTKTNLPITFSVTLFKKHSRKASTADNIDINKSASKFKTSVEVEIIESSEKFVEITIYQKFFSIIKISKSSISALL